MKNGVRIAICAAAAVCLIAGAVSGHRPISIGESYPDLERAAAIGEIDVSQVAYVTLTADAPELWLTFEIQEADVLRLSLGIPFIERLADFRPWIAVLGPGLPASDLPFLPTGIDGGIVFRANRASAARPFYEPFTGTESWITVEETVDLPEAGRYYVVAWAAPEEADKLWVAVGFLERFTVGDILSLPTIVGDVRAFHELGPRKPVLPWESLLVLSVFAAVLFGRLASR